MSVQLWSFWAPNSVALSDGTTAEELTGYSDELALAGTLTLPERREDRRRRLRARVQVRHLEGS
jgi:hypothetical protein